MKLILIICATAVFGTLNVAPLFAQQEPILPAVEAQPSGQPDASATPAPQLIPADLLPKPNGAASPSADILTIPQLDSAFAPPPAPLATQVRRAHLEWRTLRNRLDNDPKFKASRADAEAAPTDLEKRRRLRSHYETYYARLISLASPEWKSFMNDRRNEVLNTLPQPRVRPSATPGPTKP